MVIHILWGERQDLIIHHKRTIRCTILQVQDPASDPASLASLASLASSASLASLFLSTLLSLLLSPLLSPLLLGPISEIGLGEEDDLVLNCWSVISWDEVALFVVFACLQLLSLLLLRRMAEHAFQDDLSVGRVGVVLFVVLACLHLLPHSLSHLLRKMVEHAFQDVLSVGRVGVEFFFEENLASDGRQL